MVSKKCIVIISKVKLVIIPKPTKFLNKILLNLFISLNVFCLKKVYSKKKKNENSGR